MRRRAEPFCNELLSGLWLPKPQVRSVHSGAICCGEQVRDTLRDLSVTFISFRYTVVLVLGTDTVPELLRSGLATCRRSGSFATTARQGAKLAVMTGPGADKHPSLEFHASSFVRTGRGFQK